MKPLPETDDGIPNSSLTSIEKKNCVSDGKRANVTPAILAAVKSLVSNSARYDKAVVNKVSPTTWSLEIAEKFCA
jgi:hypothetical protein